METIELIEKLRQYYEDFGQGRTQSFFKITSDCKEAADKLEKLQRFVNDILGDHYIDYLEFYTNRCRELEKELSIQKMLVLNGESAIETNKALTQKIAKLVIERNDAIEDIKRAITDEDLCTYCKNNLICEGKNCSERIEGHNVMDENGEELDMEWSCEDFDWGECPKLQNTPCNGCLQGGSSGFEWRGLKER